jgi:hypothetical protein
VSVRGFGARADLRHPRHAGCSSTAFPRRCPTARARCRTSTWPRRAHRECCAGPFSALYGNAAGGVIQVSPRDGADAPGLRWLGAGSVRRADARQLGLARRARRARLGARLHALPHRRLPRARAATREVLQRAPEIFTRTRDRLCVRGERAWIRRRRRIRSA